MKFEFVTGQVIEVADKTLLRLIKKDTRYKEVKEVKEPKTKTTSKKEEK